MILTELNTSIDRKQTISKQSIFIFKSDLNYNNYKKIGNYILTQTLGKGTFGKVKIGIHLPTNEKVAVKILDKEKIVDKNDLERVSREIHILKIMRHHNIVHLFDTISSKNHIYLIMEYADGGDLFDFICKNKRLDEMKACYIFQQLISSVEYIHKLGIVHRDIKPENILLDGSFNMKLVDFGLSNTYKHGFAVKTACGSPCYAAPEMISGKSYHGLGSDIWSSGVVLFCMLCGYLPFDDDDLKSLYKKITNGTYKLPNFISDSAKDLIKNILQVDLTKRYTIEQIKQHPWYRNVKQNLDEGIFIGINNIKYDEGLVKEVINLLGGESGEELIKSIKNNKHNNMTTCYYLMMKKKIKQEEKKKNAAKKFKFTTNNRNVETFKFSDNETKTTEIHNKNVNVVVINNILTEPQNIKNKIKLNLSKQINKQNKDSKTRNINHTLLLSNNTINNNTKQLSNNLYSFSKKRASKNKIENKSINIQPKKQNLDSSFNKKSSIKSPNQLTISTTPINIFNNKLNFERPKSSNPYTPNNESYSLKYNKLNDSSIKTKFEKKINCSKVKKILKGQSYNVENSSMMCAWKDSCNFSGATSTKHSSLANHSRNIINLKYRTQTNNNNTYVKSIDLRSCHKSTEKDKSLLPSKTNSSINKKEIPPIKFLNNLKPSTEKKTSSIDKNRYKPTFLKSNAKKIEINFGSVKSNKGNDSKFSENELSFISTVIKTKEN